MFFCVFFFFKQKTAYEMRISDWSSDVCSSDLMDRQGAIVESIAQKVDSIRGSLSAGPASKKPIVGATAYKRNRPPANDVDAFAARIKRSEERRVGKECVSTCRSRWLTYR